MTRPIAIALYALVAFFLLVFLVYPILSVLKDAFFDVDGRFTLDFVGAVFGNPLYLEGFANAFRMAVFSTFWAMIIAIPLAVVSDRFVYPGKGILSSLILLPLVLPPFVGAIGIKKILGPTGALNSALDAVGLMDPNFPIDWIGESRLFGVVVMNALHLYPIIYLNVAAALANLDPAFDQAAENLGCTGWRRFWRITLPLTMPGVFAGATVVFIWSFTELGVPLIFDFNRVTPVQIFHELKDLGGNPIPYALVAVMLAASAAIFLLSKLLFGRGGFTSTGRASIGTSAAPPPKAWHAWACSAAFSVVTAVAVLPHLGVVLTAFSHDWYRTVLPADLTLENVRDALGHDVTLASIRNSLKYASLATFLDLFLGVVIAYLVVRTRLPGRQVLDALAMMPLAVPGLVMAFGYLSMSREGGPFAYLAPGGSPFLLLVIAYAVRRLPYVVRSAAAGFQQTSPSLEEAAENLGATPARALRRITLPLIAANLVAGGMLAFAFAMLEVSDSLVLAQQRADFPITKAIYGLYRTLGNGEALAAALGSWAMVFLAVTIVGASILIGRRLGALFRV